MSDLFALIDCNNFYVSCERLFAPKLKKKPVAILSNNDGCVIARSQEVKDLGIKMGTPYYQAKEFLESKGGVFFSSNYKLYGDISNRVMDVLRTFSPEVEQYSIDEAFLKVPTTELDNLEQFAFNITEKVYRWVGIPVKIGIGPSKALCKVAAKIVKNRKIRNKFFILTDPMTIIEELEMFPVQDLWGIGRRLAPKLKKLGIKTAGGLLRYGEVRAKKNFNIDIERMVRELKGEQCYSLELVPNSKKSLCFSRSFGKPVTSLEGMLESVSYYAEKAAENLRKEKQLASAVTVYITTNYFKKEDLQYSNSYTVELAHQSNSSFEVVNAANIGLRNIYRKGYRYKKSGVILTDLINEDMFQGSLFQDHNKKYDKISKVMDNINSQFGRNTIILAGGGLNKQQWKLRRNFLSKSYTTNWDDIISVN